MEKNKGIVPYWRKDMVYLLFLAVSVINAFSASLIIYFSYFIVATSLILPLYSSVKFICITTVILFCFVFIHKASNRKLEYPVMEMNISSSKTKIKHLNANRHNPLTADYLILILAILAQTAAQLVTIKFLYAEVNFGLIQNLGMLALSSLFLIASFNLIFIRMRTHINLGKTSPDLSFMFGMGILVLIIAAAVLYSLYSVMLLLPVS